ncbi:hypothetical protein [uncultured Sphingomonas sp.]|uniref:hypothetical protein n=1 Tax=uncultured Sphingomonas sp. TaxID=158754 RepID=UPI0025ECC2C4|nr:hypothetical protein [uncultured Sphingomonas sp.]
MTDALTAGWEPAQPFMVRFDLFEPDPADTGRTRYSAVAPHWSAEAAERHVAMGFEAGWSAPADPSEAVAKRLAAGA